MLSGYDFEFELFDWVGVELLKIEEKDMIVYEMMVCVFIVDVSLGLDEKMRGSYAGVVVRVDYLKAFGVNVVEFLLVFEYDEMEF